ncbi:MAG: glycerophosphodiester phosphodiesterase [Longimicrobiales bacterium]
MIVIAHRGASAYAPEHTLAAYDLALEMGADYIEQDLQMTSDGELIVLHDATLDRTARGAGCTGEVILKTLSAVQSCDVGSWFNERDPARARPEFSTQRVPTLARVLERYGGRANFYIETKNPEEAPGMEEKLVAELELHGLLASGTWQATAGDPTLRWRAMPPAVIQSFSEASLRKVRSLAPGLPLVQLFERGASSADFAATLDRTAEYAAGIGPHREDASETLIAAAHARGLVVHPYTVNDEAEMQRLMRLGVDGMFTDRPDVLADVIL